MRCGTGLRSLPFSATAPLLALHPFPSTVLGMRAARPTENEVTGTRLFYFPKGFATLTDKLGSGKILCHGQHLSPTPHVSRNGLSHQTQNNVCSRVQNQTKRMHGANAQDAIFL